MDFRVFLGSVLKGYEHEKSADTVAKAPDILFDISQNCQFLEKEYPGKMNIILFRGEPVLIDQNGRILFWRSKKTDNLAMVSAKDRDKHFRSTSCPGHCLATTKLQPISWVNNPPKDVVIAILRRDELYNVRQYYFLKDAAIDVLFISDYGKKEFSIPEALLEMVAIELKTNLFYGLSFQEEIRYQGLLYQGQDKTVEWISGFNIAVSLSHLSDKNDTEKTMISK